MPLIKIGTKTVDGNEHSVYLLQGNAVRDGELKEVGNKELGKVSVAAKELSDGSTMFVMLNGWRYKAADVAAVRKMDSVIAVGPLKKRTHNEREYWDMDVEFIVVSGVRRNAASFSDDVGVGYAEVGNAPDFADITEEDGELPF